MFIFMYYFVIFSKKMIKEKKCYRCKETKCTQIFKKVIKKEVSSNYFPRFKIGRIMGCEDKLYEIDNCGICGSTERVHCNNHVPRTLGREKLTLKGTVYERQYIPGENIQQCSIFQERMFEKTFFKKIKEKIVFWKGN